jgi:hypothetical protein
MSYEFSVAGDEFFWKQVAGCELWVTCFVNCISITPPKGNAQPITRNTQLINERQTLLSTHANRQP